MRRFLVSVDRKIKQFIVAFIDFTLIAISIYLSIFISTDEIEVLQEKDFLILFIFPLLSVYIFYLIGVYRSVLRFIDFSSIYLLLKAITITLLIIFFSAVLISSIDEIVFSKLFGNIYQTISLQSWIIASLLIIFSISGVRLAANFFLLDIESSTKVAIYGAGAAGIQLAGALRVSSEMKPVAFIDSDRSIQNTFLGGLKVLSPSKLKKLIARKQIDEVLIAMPSAQKSTLTNLLKEIEEYSIKVRILPGLTEIASGKVLVSELKEVDVQDLLGRAEVEASQGLLEKNIKDKIVLITGAGGSIGSEIARQVVAIGVNKIILLDSNEYALYEIKNEINLHLTSEKIISVIGNVCNQKRIEDVCKTFEVNTIFHTAAYKHVPLVEENPFEGFTNNVLGTKSCLKAAVKNNVETFVLISTDKAVRPTNIMGATKRLAEMILQAYAADKNLKTKITMVRFGNVLGSSGSAVPLFQKQIKSGGPITVTHPEVIRFFMSIPEAAELVIQAGAMGKGGDVFVLDMGEPVKILELAKRLVNLSGMTVKDENNPEGDIEIIFTGLKPGEKLYEELLIGANVSTTEHKQILRAEEDFLSDNELEIYFNSLKEAEKSSDVLALRRILKQVVSGFTPEEEIVDVIYHQQNIQLNKK